jgi:D-alanine-D-alanine ligase
MGGPSSEREVSLRSGAAVADALREAGVPRVDTCIVAPDCTFALPPGTESAFVALHGRFGEDGTIQRILEDRRIPHTGSTPDASALAFDKSRAKPALAAAGVPTAPYELLRAGDTHTLPLPLVVKPVRQGSSVGVSRVFEEKDFPAALDRALALDGVALVESFVPGRELTVGVVGGELLPLLQIEAPGDCYDYRSKYAAHDDPACARHLCPAPLAPAEEAACRDAALAAVRALGCHALGRVDMRLTPDGHPFVLELNNIPGLTPVSLLPDMARARGWSYPSLCLRILNLAI